MSKKTNNNNQLQKCSWLFYEYVTLAFASRKKVSITLKSYNSIVTEPRTILAEAIVPLTIGFTLLADGFVAPTIGFTMVADALVICTRPSASIAEQIL